MGSRTLYLDLNAGISGDMFLSALVQLADCQEHLETQLRLLNIEAWSLSLRPELRGAFSGYQLSFDIGSSTTERTFSTIKSLIDSSTLSAWVKQKSIEVFHRLALAESKIHGVSVGDVHFHEVGAVDSILDIVGVAICVEYLQLDSILFSAIPVGRGSVETRHGKTTLPAPATMELMSGYQVESAPADMEWVTPTGMALLSCFGEQSMVMPAGRIEKSVYAAGAANPPSRSNILRGTMFVEAKVSPCVLEIHTNIDDMTAEEISFLSEQLWTLQPLDLWLQPIFMKKNRPAVKLSMLIHEDSFEAVQLCLFKHSSTLGIRYAQVKRKTLSRRQISVETPYGHALVKQAMEHGVAVRSMPEYESCARLAREHNVSYQTVYQSILRAISS